MRKSELHFAQILIAASLLSFALASPLRGEGALAVAIPDDGLSKGFTFGVQVNAANPDDARKQAMAACQENVKKNQEDAKERKIKILPARCKIVESFKNACIAVALDKKGQWAGWAIFKDEKTARSRAILRCKDGGSECVVTDMQCDKQKS